MYPQLQTKILVTIYRSVTHGKFQPHAGGANVALAGIDYGNSPVVVTFAAGETVSSKARIPIKDDGPGDHNEQFRATFELPSGYTNIQKGTPSEAVVTILEEEIGTYAWFCLQVAWFGELHELIYRNPWMNDSIRLTFLRIPCMHNVFLILLFCCLSTLMYTHLDSLEYLNCQFFPCRQYHLF